MKKTYIILIIVILIVALATGLYFLYNKIKEDEKKYEVEEVKEYNFFAFRTENKYGIMDKKGNPIIEAKYINVTIPNPEKAVFICEDENKKIVFNDKNEEIFADYENIEAIRLKNLASSFMYEKSVLVYKENEKYGLVDFKGKRITKPIYDNIESVPYKEGELLVTQNGKMGIINIKGVDLIKPQYDVISVDNYFVENEGYKYSGYIIGEKTEDGYRHGYIDSKWNLVVEPKYNDLYRIIDISNKDELYLVVADNGRYGVLKGNTLVIPNEYQSIRYDKTNDIIIVEKIKKFGVMNLDGKEIIPIKYNQIDVTGMYIYAKNGETVEVYDKDGNKTDIDGNTSIINTENTNYKVKIENIDGKTSYSLINREGKKITKNEYAYLEYIGNDSFIASLRSGKIGIIDFNENEKIQIKYDSIEKIQNTDLIRTILNEEKVNDIYSKDFKVLTSMKDAIIENKEDYLKIYNAIDTEYYDLKGNKKDYKEIDSNRKLYAKKMENGKWSFEDKNGKNIEGEYDKVTEFNKYGFAGIKKDGKWGVMNEDGTIIQEPIYAFKGDFERDFINKYYKVEYGLGEFFYTDEQ